MREAPPQELVALIERLRLATPSQIARLGRRARRLARGLPLFDSVWLDVLIQARSLTRFQAEAISAGRGPQLQVGPYLLCRPLPSPGYVEAYLAREAETSQPARVAVVRCPPEQAEWIAGQLEHLAAKGRSLDCGLLAPVTRTGIDGDRVWVAGRHVAGRTAAEWVVNAGRFAPTVVLEIARQMVAGLSALEQAGLCHTDVHPSGVILSESGDTVLPQPGLRGIVLPRETVAGADLEPEAYDCMAPERIAAGSPFSIAGDLYACGCVWWHLLCGRAPIPGADTSAKLCGLRTSRIAPVTRLAPGTPAPLATAIGACLEREPGARPESFARLAEILGPPTRSGRRALGRQVSRRGWRPPQPAAMPSRRPLRPAPSWTPTVAGCLIAAVAIGWSLWHTGASTRRNLDSAIAARAIDESTTSGESTPAEHATGGQSTSIAQSSTPDRAEAPAAPTGVPPAPGSGRTDQALDRDHVGEVILPGDGPIPAESLQIRPGQCLRGRPVVRARVVISRAGLAVRPEGVRFENVDFVWEDRPAPAAEVPAEPTIVHVSASRADFRACSFRAAPGATQRPVAIRWTYPADRSRAETALFSGRLRLTDCLLGHVGGGVACETLGAPAIQMANVLYLGAGPLVELDHCPRADEPVLLALTSVTMRDSGPLLECRYGEIPNQPGSLSIQAEGCALVTRARAPLLSFWGAMRPERILGKIRWTGQGSLILPEAAVAAWRNREGEVRQLDDSLVSIAGLVRSKVEFAGFQETGAEANGVVRCQVPLRSANLPGIDPRAIAWPWR